jgi:hypothetical protein
LVDNLATLHSKREANHSAWFPELANNGFWGELRSSRRAKVSMKPPALDTHGWNYCMQMLISNLICVNLDIYNWSFLRICSINADESWWPSMRFVWKYWANPKVGWENIYLFLFIDIDIDI